MWASLEQNLPSDPAMGGWGRLTHEYEILQSILCFLTRPAFKRNYFTRASTIGAFSEPNWLREELSLTFLAGKEKIPTPVHASHLVPPKRRKYLKSTCEVHSPEA